MPVRAKFKCESNKVDGDNGSQITLAAVYDSDPNSENGKFFKYTPSGQIRLGIVNEAASQQFEEGREYYVDFSPAG